MRRIINEQIKVVSDKQCPICASKNFKIFFEELHVPIHCNLLLADKDAAQNCPRGDIKLAFCTDCGYIWNLAFDPDRLEYTQDYECSLFHSTRYQEHAKMQALRLVERYNLYNKDIIEIGCGKGYFLLLLCKLGDNNGIGFDPTYIIQENYNELEGRVKFIPDFYSERYLNYHADLFVCRYVLEHIQNPKNLLNLLRKNIGNRQNTYVFFEVPNALHTFNKLQFWDIIYEHCSYFTPFTLTFTFSSCGFNVCELNETYEGQFLYLDAVPDSQHMIIQKHELQGEVNQIANYITSFAVNYRNKIETCKTKLRDKLNDVQRAVLWGAGSRGVNFLNKFKDLQIEYAVDINPRKQWMYIPGTGQRIVSPEFLIEYQPDIIIIMNPIYKNEIRELIKKFGIKSKLITV